MAYVKLCGSVAIVLAIAVLLETWPATVAVVEDRRLSTRIRWRRHTCSSLEVRCKSGQCIPAEQVCDGIPHCRDRSDERADTCSNIRCPSLAFRCNYGACVDGDARCNGKRDCADSSDEVGCPNTTTLVEKCRKTQFKCENGECIHHDLVCDGFVNCIDGSDETTTVCFPFRCNSRAFRCTYGACVNGDTKCDGKHDCVDGSDEAGCPSRPSPIPLTTPAPVPGPGECVLPDKIPPRSYYVPGCEAGDTSALCRTVPGTVAEDFVTLAFSCDNPGFQLQGPKNVYCQGGKWKPKLPSCIPATASFCSPLISSSVEITCRTADDLAVDCKKAVPVGTVADLRCRVAYQLVVEPGYRDIRCLPGGQWNYPLFSCVPECGKQAAASIFLANAQDAKLSAFPWHVGVYMQDGPEKFSQVCGGSLVSTKHVISAAHCFWNKQTKKLFDKKIFRFSMGKYFRTWETDEEFLQRVSANSIDIPERYSGVRGLYESDIAIVVLKVEITLGVAVRPVCIDWGDEFTQDHLSSGSHGSVVGWGVTERQVASETLRFAELPFVEYRQCKDNIPDSFKPYITLDKFCAGYDNGTSVCPGDSGGGLCFKENERWYLRGIVSVGVPPKGEDLCTIDNYAAFTNVARHLMWLRKHMV